MMKIFGNVKQAIFSMYDIANEVFPEPLGPTILHENGWMKLEVSAWVVN
jgi:hypothetical protein